MAWLVKLIFTLIPKNLMSRMAGSLVHISLPKPLANLTVIWFIKKYEINTEEPEKDWREYKSIGQFFTRKLRPDARPITDCPIIHPVDAEVIQYGPISSGQYIQAKGLSYSVAELTGDKTAREKFAGGFFVTYYLAPYDYHRVHSPVDGFIKKIKHIPGALWPVGEWAVKSVPRLYLQNERVVIELRTDWGPVSVVMVGAYNVGKIGLTFEPRLKTNDGTSKPRSREYNDLPLQKGSELGYFDLGSTVVVCYPAPVVENFQNFFQLGPEVVMGDAFVQNQTL